MAAARGPRGEIAVGDLLQDGRVEFEMDRSVEVDWSNIFVRHVDNGTDDGTDKTTTFLLRQDEKSLLNLTCLDDLRNKLEIHGEKERFIPEQVFLREYMQEALKLRLDNHHGRTIVFGSPGIGKSVFCFLAAIAFTSLEVTKTGIDAVLHVRKVTDEAEGSISVFWMTRKDDRTVKIVATRGVDFNWSVNEVCRAITGNSFVGKSTR